MVAASSLGKCPRARTARRSFEFSASIAGQTRCGECQEFRVRGAVEHYAAMALMKRSPKMTANWALAMVHSRGGILHSFSDLFKIK